MSSFNSVIRLSSLLVLATMVGCSSNSNNGGSGGAAGAGDMAGVGGSGNGGSAAAGMGGSSAATTGGSSATATGGSKATGGSAAGVGGSSSIGGSTAGTGGGAAGACGALSYSWGPLVVPNGASWTIQIKCAAPSTAVSCQCVWEDGVTNFPNALGSTDSSGNFTLVSGVGNATFPPSVAGWATHTSNACDLYVGSSVVLHVVFTPQ
jgi:hypothetical protein